MYVLFWLPSHESSTRRSNVSYWPHHHDSLLPDKPWPVGCDSYHRQPQGRCQACKYARCSGISTSQLGAQRQLNHTGAGHRLRQGGVCHNIVTTSSRRLSSSLCILRLVFIVYSIESNVYPEERDLIVLTDVDLTTLETDKTVLIKVLCPTQTSKFSKKQ